MKHWLSSKSHPLSALPWKWEWGKQALFPVCFNASLWEESSIPDTPGAFTPQNSEGTALSPADQSAGQMGKSKARDSKWQETKSSSTTGLSFGTSASQIPSMLITCAGSGKLTFHEAWLYRWWQKSEFLCLSERQTFCSVFCATPTKHCPYWLGPRYFLYQRGQLETPQIDR